MHKTLVIILTLTLLAVSAFAQTTPPPAKSTEELMKEFRTESQKSKADILAKNMTLSAEQAAKFWPMFEAYQKDQNGIIDEQLRGVKNYLEHFENLDDASALGLINAHFERDVKMDGLRKKWLPEFQKVLGTKLAVRAMQIDRRLSLAAQFEIARQIPLAR